LFDGQDISGDHKDVPCTCTLQFLVRGGALDMFVTMRSNDAYKGLPHDVFAFTMLQEMMARDLGCSVGRYKHAAGSLHLYESDQKKVDSFLEEAWQDVVEMPPMPAGSSRGAVQILRTVEANIRAGADVNAAELGLDGYWADLVRLLQVYSLTRNRGA